MVGVVKNVKHNGITGEVKPTFYRPQQQWPVSTGSANRSMTLVVKTAGDPMDLLPSIRGALSGIDRRLPVSNIQTLEQVMATALAQPRFTMALLLVFGALALGLALVGIYGVVSYVVTQRKHTLFPYTTLFRSRKSVV